MKVLILGATGYIGSAVAAAAAARGHRVVGVARSDASAKAMEARGYEVLRADLRQPEAIAQAARGVDATIHAANTQEADNSVADPALVRAILRSLEGTGKRFVYTSGIWGVGRTGDAFVDETGNGSALPLVAWRDAVQEEVVAAAKRGVHTVVVSPAAVYGRAGGMAAGFVAEARKLGHVRVVGDGAQEWTLVHVDDLADLYVRALHAPAGSIYFGAAPGTVRFRDIAIAASLAGGAKGRVREWTHDEARQAFGGFADALALHQRVSGRKAEAELGWRPRAGSVIEDLLVGSYAQ